jgi:hypothetical protein
MRGAVMAMALVFVSSAFAANESSYTDFKIETCKNLTPGAENEEGSASSGIFECKGYGGMPYTFAEDDLRSLVAFGKKGNEHCAFTQTFSGFNSVGTKIEWRLSKGKPIATIVRWSVSYDSEDSSKQRSWLVITKLEPTNSCHMGYVEGSVPNANEKARALADEALGFSCNGDVPKVIAKPGTDVTSVASPTGCSN